MEIQLWREILNPYDLAVKELTVKFEHLIQEHRQQGLYSPIEQVHGRVKTISSILDKAQKKNIPINEIEEKLEDIAGTGLSASLWKTSRRWWRSSAPGRI